MAVDSFSLVLVGRIYRTTLYINKDRICLTIMGAINDKSSHVSAESKGAAKSDKPLKPCCACPETKKARDECIITKGEEYCGDYIEAHKTCMRSMGFNI